ncbi:hypothetical protein ACP26L_08970 [Paenibacillus sp. S-38]|uniref:hypothetical protein n=1 Tax=Paenibacillus sp. S-38 TaxID=3416710 RepID=UPI003CF955A3
MRHCGGEPTGARGASSRWRCTGAVAKLAANRACQRSGRPLGQYSASGRGTGVIRRLQSGAQAEQCGGEPAGGARSVKP